LSVEITSIIKSRSYSRKENRDVLAIAVNAGRDVNENGEELEWEYKVSLKTANAQANDL